MGIQLDLKRQANTIIEKITSARFIISVMIIWTICMVTDKSMDILAKSIADKEQFLAVKEVFVYLMGIVSGIAGTITTLYFTRQDRKAENGTGGGEQK